MNIQWKNQKLKKKNTPSQQIQQLRQNLHAKGEFNKLTIAHTRGITFIELTDIIALEADGNYTKIYVSGSETVLASKTLGYFDELLSERRLFFRTHKQFIISLNFIKEYLSGDYNEIVLKNGLTAKVARTRREAFLALFKGFWKQIPQTFARKMSRTCFSFLFCVFLEKRFYFSSWGIVY